MTITRKTQQNQGENNDISALLESIFPKKQAQQKTSTLYAIKTQYIFQQMGETHQSSTFCQPDHPGRTHPHSPW
jgi:hypothetical protein